MKNIVLLIVAFSLALTGCKENALKKVNEANLAQAAERDAKAQSFPKIEFDKKNHDFGKISEGTNVETEFTFKNVGNAPLVITDIKTTCGCTVPQWSKEPIGVGETSSFKVNFNGSGQNKVTKSITVLSNSEKGQEVLQITAFITPKRTLEVN